MISRRDFIASLVTLAAPLVAQAQGSGRVPRVGILFTGAPPPESVCGVEAFRRGLRALGYVEGRNIALECRWAAKGRPDRTDRFAVAVAAR